MFTVPSALSLEEERLMKSIDRLNEKLIGQTGQLCMLYFYQDITGGD